MASWHEFAARAPELAAFGQSRFESDVAYLDTIRPDGGPRVHPVTPIIGEQLFVFMEPTSPKGSDLQHDRRYMLHCSVEDSSGGAGEFYVRGTATLTTDPLDRAEAARVSSYEPAERYVLFVLSIEFACENRYTDGKPVRLWWRAT